jgi:hypothetical protein
MFARGAPEGTGRDPEQERTARQRKSDDLIPRL